MPKHLTNQYKIFTYFSGLLCLCAFAPTYAKSLTANSDFLNTPNFYAEIQFIGHHTQALGKDVIASDLGNEVFDTNHSEHLNMAYGLRLGVNRDFNSHWSMSWGLGYYYHPQQNYSGQYYSLEGTNPSLNYTYKTQTQRLMAETNLYWQASKHLQFFVGGGAGLTNLKNSMHFTTIVYPGGKAYPFPAVTQFADKLGFEANAGFRYMLTPNWEVSFGAKKLWLGKHQIRLNMAYPGDPANYKTINLGWNQPWEYWLGLGYQF